MPFSFRLSVALALSALAVSASASPGDVNADAFYRDAKELTDKGMRAMFDKRTKPRMAQLEAAAADVRAENEAATKRGAPLYCVSDAERKKGLDAKKIVQMLGRVPEAQRKRLTLTRAWRAALIREYPCA